MHTYKILVALICLIFTVNLVQSKLNDDLITFPKYPSNYNFEVYSGYLQNNSKSKIPLHYILETQIGASNPQDSPIILWLAGGDGCSSLSALIQQIGPYRMRYPKSTILQTLNDYAWNQKANVLFIEAPVGVGFSYTGKDDKGSYEISDETTAQDLYDSLLYFFANKFTIFAQSSLIIAGEGDAAQFITLLAEKIYAGNSGKTLGATGYINLQSLILQSPIFETDDSSTFWEHERSLELLDYHGVYGPLMEDVWYDCVDATNNTPECAYFKEQFLSAKVQINPYNINDKCQKRAASPNEFEDEVSDSAYCVSWQNLESFMNAQVASFNLGDTYDKNHLWQECSYYDEINYINYEGGVITNLSNLIKDNNLFVVIISGLEDSVSSYLQAESDVQKIIKKAKLTDDGNLNAFYNGEFQVAGVSSDYGNLQWARVKDGGHFAVGDNAAAGYYILTRTILKIPIAG